jgi:divalent metal cation (Fe/Co/Zn/Cd) transporter
MSKDQRVRLGWCGCHFFAAFLVYTTKNVSLTALSALSHLLFYDAMGATLCVAVDILSNFQVWKQSSIHHPFGLERIAVLVGFALSVGLIFMGGDIVSHSIQDIIQQMFYSGQHSNHDHHHHHNIEVQDVKWTSMVLRVALAILVTIISAIGLSNHNRISDMTDSSRSSVGLSLMTFNPSHLITLTFSILILLIPFFGYFATLDTILTPLIAVSMCVVGWNLAKRLGGMLVMSYSGPDYIQEIETKIKQSVVAVDMKISDISIWQVHHDLWLGSMNITVNSDLDEDDESLLRKTASDIIKNTMIEEVNGGSRWETTIDIKKI